MIKKNLKTYLVGLMIILGLMLSSCVMPDNVFNEPEIIDDIDETIIDDIDKNIKDPNFQNLELDDNNNDSNYNNGSNDNDSNLLEITPYYKVNELQGIFEENESFYFDWNYIVIKRISNNSVLVDIFNLTKAISLDNNNVSFQNENTTIIALLNNIFYDVVEVENCTQNRSGGALIAVNKIYNETIIEDRFVPRIMYWYGKVNQHWDMNKGSWETDPDGLSGSNIDMLTYCNKFYPGTEEIKEFKNETITTWRVRGNKKQYSSTKISYECVGGNQDKFIPRIMYWSGKVNQHWDMNKGSWETDSDGVSGANMDKLTYCKKFYPNTVEVIPYAEETISTWRNAGNTGSFTSKKLSYECIEPSSNPREIFLEVGDTTNIFNKEIKLDNISNEFIVLNVNGEYNLVYLNNNTLVSDMNIKLNKLFYVDMCAPTYENRRAQMTFIRI